MAVKILLRRDTTSNWSLNNPILSNGEVGIEIIGEQRKIKLGDGLTDWNSLPYLIDAPVNEDELQEHMNNDTTAHGIDSVISSLNITNTNLSITNVNLQEHVDNDSDAHGIDTIKTDLADGLSAANNYTDSRVDNALNEAKQYANELSLASQRWLQSVKLESDLLNPPIDPLTGEENPEQTWLCKVTGDTTDKNGVYQWVSGGTSWDYYDPNWDYVTAEELAGELEPITDDVTNVSHGLEIIETEVSDVFRTVSAISDNYVTTDTDQTISGTKTFNSIKVPIPTNNDEAANKEYVDFKSGTVDYSLAEQDTGLKWVDGKSIYRITIPFSMGADTGAKNFDIFNVNTVSMKYLIKLDLHLLYLDDNSNNYSGGSFVALNGVSSNTYVSASRQGSLIRVYRSVGWSGSWTNNYCTIEYTKK